MTADELRRLTSEKEKAILGRIDDYTDTIRAILGFCSLWFYDPATRSNRPNVKVFQGRHLPPVTSQSGAVVCPDLGIIIDNAEGILGEVKKNFPKNDDQRKKDIFAQLKSYDQELAGWPTPDELLKQHDIVLLVHQTTSVSACDYWKSETASGRLKFDRHFAIFQFNRSDQRIPYFFFQRAEGTGSQPAGGIDVRQGVPVPMQALVELYSESKLYDAEPPLPYLLHLIWENVIIPIACEDSRFAKLHRNQKMEVTVAVEDIVERLHQGFSFSHWHRAYPNRQPKAPKSEWVQTACQSLVDAGEAKWITKSSDLVVYYRKYDDVLAHFVKLQAESDAKLQLQPLLLDYNGSHPEHKN